MRRLCEACRQPLVRRANERDSSWARRRCCSRQCNGRIPKSMLRWPVGPLLVFAGTNTRGYEVAGARSGQDRVRLQRLGLTDAAADAAATRLGVHPLTIWPDWCDAARLPFYEPDAETERLWWWRDVTAEQRRVLAERWAA